MLKGQFAHVVTYLSQTFMHRGKKIDWVLAVTQWIMHIKGSVAVPKGGSAKLITSASAIAYVSRRNAVLKCKIQRQLWIDICHKHIFIADEYMAQLWTELQQAEKLVWVKQTWERNNKYDHVYVFLLRFRFRSHISIVSVGCHPNFI